METFLKSNPGLRSRIAFHVDFPDYTENELTEILRLIAKEKSMNLTDKAIEKANTIFGQAVKKADFGNGRFVRNLLEQAMMNMAQRLAETDFSRISDEMLTMIEEEDIFMPKIGVNINKNNRIGF